MVTGVIHSIVVGLPLYGQKWLEFAGKFFLNVTPHTIGEGGPLGLGLIDLHAEAALWFFMTGVPLFVLGQVVDGVERST